MEESRVIDRSNTFVDLLRQRGTNNYHKTAFIYLKDGETETDRLTYGKLDLHARAIATYLQSICSQGDRALLIYPSGLDFISAFFGCLYGGIVAVPAYPPKPNRPWSRVRSIVEDAAAKIVLTTRTILEQQGKKLRDFPDLAALTWIATDEIESNLATEWQKPNLNSNSLAFLQYTSGSTGNPKGVMVSHGNLLHNQQMIRAAFGHTEKTVFVGWLPLFHDMGLIGNVLQPVYLGIHCILISPLNFLYRPFAWLQAISHYRATTSGAPNFAYDLCVKRTTPEQRASLDLSSWAVAFNGAEPVRQETLENFTKAFASCGFTQKAFYPCYGLAEATLLVTGGDRAIYPSICKVNPTALARDRILVEKENNQYSKSLISCGRTWLGTELLIVNPESLKLCADGRVGEIWVRGKSVAVGYWNKPEATQQVFQASISEKSENRFLRTGDVGFVKDGELFVTGRYKDVIIIKGRNYYPEDIELTVQHSHPGLRLNGGAAFTIDNNIEQRLTVVQEIERSYIKKLNRDSLVGDIRQAVMANHELQAHEIILVKPGTVPKTSSGKICRYACREKFIDGQLNTLN
ncbi:fatty acyl-AMP ligase [Myxosarcina sp. GI1]|uniref:fatty acyl-AMP ligase n=1 Tax=Myxosarcina sp. GI1 TaxID=1541065 RepID=UPI00055A97A3|nr:fatty acyl-AMP ligase [Myxosarcina sp. GI1]